LNSGHSTSLFFVMGFFEIGSCILFAQAGLEPQFVGVSHHGPAPNSL
jgi:hypothetical protein